MTEPAIPDAATSHRLRLRDRQTDTIDPKRLHRACKKALGRLDRTFKKWLESGLITDAEVIIARREMQRLFYGGDANAHIQSLSENVLAMIQRLFVICSFRHQLSGLPGYLEPWFMPLVHEVAIADDILGSEVAPAMNGSAQVARERKTSAAKPAISRSPVAPTHPIPLAVAGTGTNYLRQITKSRGPSTAPPPTGSEV